MNTGREEVLHARGIDFSYGQRPVLSGVDLSVYSGEIVGLLGPNGTGKSTLVGVLAGDLEAQSGNVELKGKALSDYDRVTLAQTRAVMPQNSDFPFAYLSRDIVMMGRACWSGVATEIDDDELVDECMKKTASLDFADREVTRLSGGEKARVTLARVLAQQADIVFLDEPTAALDISHQERTMEICCELADEGKAVIAVMHDIQLAGAYCDTIALMYGGAIVAYGPPSEVLTSDRLTQVYECPIKTMVVDDGQIVVVPQRRSRRKT